MQAARTPNLDSLAQTGIVGRSKNVPDGMPPGSDVATLGLLGYAPSQFYTGRAPLEAAAQGIELATDDWAIRCNFVTIGQSANHLPQNCETQKSETQNCVTQNSDAQKNPYMQSFTAGHISSEEAALLIETLNEKVAPLSPVRIQFYAGVSYRNLGITRNNAPFTQQTKTFPPHDYTDKPITNVLPNGEGSELLRFLMDESRKVFENHPVNQKRLELGKLPATQIWLWGIGQKPQIPLFATRFTLKPIHGAMITAVDLLRGIANLIGWDIINVPGITGYVDTDYAAKGNYAAKTLRDHDLVCVHIEATDEAGHEGSVEKKVQAMEDIDTKILPPILDALKSHGEWRLFVSPDHPTPIALKTHTSDYVPWLLAGSDITDSNASAPNYDEENARNSNYRYDNGWEMLPLLFRGIKGREFLNT
jgi:2,3-bisphosphoglycerate-independent phosphoglycerate mutase